MDDPVSARFKSLHSSWLAISIIGSATIYAIGYLALRSHLTVMGVDIIPSTLDEQYFFEGLRCVIYLVSSIPILLLLGLLVLPIVWLAWMWCRASTWRLRCIHQGWSRLNDPTVLSLLGITVSVVLIQFVMRKCFFFANLPFRESLPAPYGAGWMRDLLLSEDDVPTSFYIGGLVVGCAFTSGIFHLCLRRRPRWDSGPGLLTGLLAVVLIVQFSLLPMNYGYLVMNKTVPLLESIEVEQQGNLIASEGEAWLVWTGNDEVYLFSRNAKDQPPKLVVVPRDQVKRTVISGHARILPALIKSSTQASGEQPKDRSH